LKIINFWLFLSRIAGGASLGLIGLGFGVILSAAWPGEVARHRLAIAAVGALCFAAGAYFVCFFERMKKSFQNKKGILKRLAD